MHRIYLEKIPSIQEIRLSDRDQVHHLFEVIRARIGDIVEIFDGKGNWVEAEIEEIDRREGVFKVTKRMQSEKNKKSLFLTIGCSLIKINKMELIVEKLTEIGVERIIFFETTRSQIRRKDLKNKLQRFEKIAISALKQCGNRFLPRIEFLKFQDILNMSHEFDLALMPCLKKDIDSLKDVLVKEKEKRNIILVIGPEGDFSPEEVNLATKHGFFLVTLGENILRSETAAIVCAGFIKLFYANGN